MGADDLAMQGARASASTHVKPTELCPRTLTHWGRVTHICVGKLTIMGLDNGFSPGRHQAIIWTNAGILFIEPWGTNFSEILIKIYTFSFKKMHLIVSSAKRRPFCLSLIVLRVNNVVLFTILCYIFICFNASYYFQITSNKPISAFSVIHIPC